ncbi:MAG: hypothetical protein QOI28_2630 [Mycobacterium sp.]|nr:hypothetical protein [Mycobacterium sp.]
MAAAQTTTLKTAESPKGEATEAGAEPVTPKPEDYAKADEDAAPTTAKPAELSPSATKTGDATKSVGSAHGA